MDENNKPTAPHGQLSTPEKTARADEKKQAALFFSAGGVTAMVFAIVLSAYVFCGLIANAAAWNLFGMCGSICEALLTVGVWLTFASAKKQKLSPKGVALIRVPFIVIFAFDLIGAALRMTMYVVFSFEFLPFLLNLLKFVFGVVYFFAVDKLLRLCASVGKDRARTGKTSGTFAAVAVIIFAAATLAISLLYKIEGDALLEIMLTNAFTVLRLEPVTPGGSAVIAIEYVAMISRFLVSVYAAAMILSFDKKLGQNA